MSRAVAATDAYVGLYYSSIMALFEVCNKPVFALTVKIFMNRMMSRSEGVPRQGMFLK